MLEIIVLNILKLKNVSVSSQDNKMEKKKRFLSSCLCHIQT